MTSFRVGLVGYETGPEELDAIRLVLESGVLTNGPRTVAFEAEFARLHGVAHAVAVANGTLALAGLYLALGIGPGDEVIVPSMSFVSTATSVLHVGATPVFAEVDDQTFTLDVDDVRGRVTRNTRAIVVVHYAGQAGNLAELSALAADLGIALVEDAAQAHGATYRGRPVGGHGIAAMFSFTPTKNITTGEGGLITTSDDGLAAKLRLLRNHGQSAPYVHATLGFNWRMTEIQAAMGIAQLARLSGILARKRANAEWMRKRLQGVAGLRLPIELPDRDHPYMLYTVLVARRRDEILDYLRTAGVEARLYFPPAHLQPIFAKNRTALPVTEQLARHMISLPFHVRLKPGDLEYVAHTLEAAIGRT